MLKKKRQFSIYGEKNRYSVMLTHLMKKVHHITATVLNFYDFLESDFNFVCQLFFLMPQNLQVSTSLKE